MAGDGRKDKKKSPFDFIKGKEVTFQLIRGTIITGTFGGYYNNFFIVTNAEIIGANNICKTELAFVQKNQVQHFHLKGEVKPKSEV